MKALMLIFIAAFLALFIYATAELPDRGDPNAPANVHLSPEFVELTEKELLSVFERHHIVKLEPLGEKLDPHRHEAIYEVPDPSQPPGTVVQLIEPGYLLHDRLVRPARVGIAKGQATDPPEPEA